MRPLTRSWLRSNRINEMMKCSWDSTWSRNRSSSGNMKRRRKMRDWKRKCRNTSWTIKLRQKPISLRGRMKPTKTQACCSKSPFPRMSRNTMENWSLRKRRNKPRGDWRSSRVRWKMPSEWDRAWMWGRCRWEPKRSWERGRNLKSNRCSLQTIDNPWTFSTWRGNRRKRSSRRNGSSWSKDKEWRTRAKWTLRGWKRNTWTGVWNSRWRKRAK